MDSNIIINEMPAILKAKAMPQRTNSYQPIGHTSFVRFLAEKLEHKGYNIEAAKFSQAANGDKMVGTLRLNVGDKDFGMTMGFRNSYDKSMSLGVGVGGEVFVCSNGMFLADVQQLRKHTVNVGPDISRIVDTQINYIGEIFDKYAEDVEVMKSKEITKSTMHELIGEMFVEHKLITGPQLSIIRNEISYSENFKMLGQDGTMSLWNMYNNTTEALKKSHPTRYFKDHAKAREIILSAV